MHIYRSARQLVSPGASAGAGPYSLLLLALSSAGAFSPVAAQAQVVGSEVVAPSGMIAPLPTPAMESPSPNRPLLASPGAGQLPDALRNEPLTLDQILSVALVTNRSLAVAGASLLRAQGRTAEARAAFRPTLGAGFSYTRLSRGQSATLNGQDITLVNPDQPELGIQASLPIDLFGILRSARDQMRFQEVAARLSINRIRNQIVAEVKTAFYDVLRAEALVAVAQDNLANSRARLADTEARYTAQVAARFDVIRAQTDVSTAAEQLIEARNGVSLRLATLKHAVGLDVNLPLRIRGRSAITAAATGAEAAAEPAAAEAAPGVVPPSQPTQGTATVTNSDVVADPVLLGADYDQSVQEALRNRPEILETDAAITAARRGIRYARRSRLPSVGLSAGFFYTPNAAGLQPQSSLGEGMLSFTVPLSDGGVARAREQQARADIAAAEIFRREAVDLVTLEVRQAYLDVLEARERVEVAAQALAQARESYRLSQVRYKVGVSPLLEVSDAQAALTSAQTREVNAAFDYSNARSQLDRAIGRYSYTPHGPGYPSPPEPVVVGRSTASAGTETPR